MRRFRRRPSDAFHGAGVINESSDAGGREVIVGYQEEQRRTEGADDGADSVAPANRWPLAVLT
jgi:hypothetical protein